MKTKNSLWLRLFYKVNKYRKNKFFAGLAEGFWAREEGLSLIKTWQSVWLHWNPRSVYFRKNKPFYLFSDYKGRKHLIRASNYIEALSKAKKRKWYSEYSKIEFLGYAIE